MRSVPVVVVSELAIPGNGRKAGAGRDEIEAAVAVEISGGHVKMRAGRSGDDAARENLFAVVFVPGDSREPRAGDVEVTVTVNVGYDGRFGSPRDGVQRLGRKG